MGQIKSFVSFCMAYELRIILNILEEWKQVVFYDMQKLCAIHISVPIKKVLLDYI